MRVKFNLKNLCNLTIYLIVCQVIVFRFFNIQTLMNKVILSLELACFYFTRKKTKITYNEILKNSWLYILVFLLILNGLVHGFGDVYCSNVLMIIYPIFNIFYITWYAKKYENSLIKMMDKICVPLNVYMWINIVVMLIQMQGTYFLIGFSNWHNPAYWDLISGLFGYSTTHVVCMFSTFVVVYDFFQLRLLKGTKQRYMKYNLLLLLLVLFSLSIVNDNVAFFLICPLAVLYCFLYSYNLKKESTIKKITISFIVVIFFAIVLFLIFPKLYLYLYNEVFYKFIGIFEMAQRGTSVSHGSLERIAQIFFGLQNLNGWILGAGLNEVGLFHDGYFGFAHFGNASAGGFVCLGGIWIWLSMCMLYSQIMVNSLIEKKKRILLCVSMFVLLLTIYTTLFTDVSIALSSFFVFLPFWHFERKKYKTKGKC